jgi:hypothetical protein
MPDALATLKLHYLQLVLFDIGKDTNFMYQGIFDTGFDKYTEDPVVRAFQGEFEPLNASVWGCVSTSRAR